MGCSDLSRADLVPFISHVTSNALVYVQILNNAAHTFFLRSNWLQRVFGGHLKVVSQIGSECGNQLVLFVWTNDKCSSFC